MKDLLNTKSGKGEVTIKAQTDKAKKVFKEQSAGDQHLIGKEKDIAKLVGLDVSHNLNVDRQYSLYMLLINLNSLFNSEKSFLVSTMK